jgi:CheY-like chemotaxis protein
MIKEYPKAVDITNSCDDYEMEIITDMEWIVSILINLLINACDNTMFGSIHLSIKKEDNFIRFEVCDTGVGIDNNDKSKLFYPFVNLKRKHTKHGLGIGLYNCAWKTRILNGTYHIEDNPIGYGTIFIIRLPIINKLPMSRDNSDEKKSGNNEKIEKEPSFDDNNIKVLIIDDTVSFRKLFKRNLEKQNIYKIDEADNGISGLKMLTENKYDIAFVDYYMPLKNGDICIKEYRVYENQHGIYPRTICVLISADELTSIETKNIFDYILLKPFDMKKIVNIIQSIGDDNPRTLSNAFN